MAFGENVGSIAYDARINTGDFNKDADRVEKRASDVASSVESSGNRGFRNFASEASSSFNSVADGLGRVLKSAVLIGTTGSVGIGAAAKASWDQVSAVQQATVALNAYEKDTGKVNKVLGELVAYARSDLGVLFNRKDLFESAQSLKIMGDNTGQLTDHVKILSRSVGLGRATWDDLNQIVGRVGSTGRLTGDDFDNLTKAGYKLDSGLRNTNITFDQLFKALDKGIPADALAGQANTIYGLGIRLQTAFRNIGDAILGVDADSNQFIKGGLGDKLVGMMGTLTTLLKDPALKDGFKRMGLAIGEFAEGALTIIIKGFSWIVTHISDVVAGVAGLTAAFVALKAVAIGTAILAGINPLMMFATAIGVLISGLTYLQLRFGYVGKALDILQPSFDLIYQNLAGITGGFKDVASSAAGVNWPVVIVGALKDGLIFLNKAIITVGTAINGLIRTAQNMYGAFMNSAPIIILGQYLQQVLWPGIMAIAAAYTQNLGPALAQFWEAIVKLWNALNPALTDALKIVGAIIGGVLLAAIWVAISVINVWIQAFSMVVSGISNLIGWMSNLISWFGNLVGVVWNTIGSIISIERNLIPATKDVVSAVVGIFAGIGKMILGAVGDLSGTLYNIGKSVIDGFINGIKDKFGDVKSTLGDLTNKLTSWKGPASLDKVILKQSGQYVIGGFISGLESMYGKVQSSLGSLTYGLPTMGAPSLGDGSLSALDAASGSSSSSNVTVNVSLKGVMSRSKSDERDIAKSLIRTLNDELSAKSQPLLGGGAI